MNAFFQDLRYAARQLLKNPGFTVIAALTLALGIGANTVIFSVVHAVLLRPLPYPQAERLLALAETRPSFSGQMSVAYPNYLDWRAGQHAFEELGVYRRESYNVTGGDREPERLSGAQVSASLFKTLGLPPRLGRVFTEEEDRPGGPNVVVLADAFWRKHFGAEPRVLGRTLQLNGQSFEILGVLPPEITTPRNVDVFVPIGLRATERFLTTRGNHPGIYGLARLKPGVTREGAAADLAAICRRLETRYPDSNTGNAVALTPLLEAAVGEYRPMLWLLSAAVGAVLLIACANLANLLLARAVGRQREIAIRSALGAGRWRIVRQLLTESVLLAMLGGAAGLLLALWGGDLVNTLTPPDVPRFRQVGMDGTVIAFTLLVSLGTGLVFGLWPAWQASRVDLSRPMKEAGARGDTGGASGRRSRALLVVSQMALACLLLSGAGLLIKSFRRLQEVQVGFEPRGVLTVRLSLPTTKYAERPARAEFYDRLLTRVAALPGVESAALSNSPPFSDGGWQSDFAVAGRPKPKPGEDDSAECQAVSADFFRALKMPVLRGRGFDPAADRYGQPLSVLIDESFARKFFPDQDPIGQHLDDTQSPGEGEHPPMTIVGIVPTVRHDDPGAEPPRVQLYLFTAQLPASDQTLLVRAAGGTRANPLALANAVRRAVLETDSDQPVYDVSTMEGRMAAVLGPRRLAVTLLGVFAGLALVLAAMGLYGVMAYSVSQRTREIGVRVALGAQRSDIFGLILRHGLGLAAVGLGVGLAGALAAGRLLAGLLYGVGAADPGVLATVVSVLGVVAVVACCLPARRAMRVDPLVALRDE